MKELLFSVTAKDCDWSYTKGSGAGGQKRNKTSSAVHCTHRASGAHGFAQDYREQRRNRELAFLRMTRSERFARWRSVEVARRQGHPEWHSVSIEQAVADQMAQRNLHIEYFDPEAA